MAILDSADLDDILLSSQDFLNPFLVVIIVYPYCSSPQSVLLFHILIEVHEVETTFMILRCYLSCLIPAHSPESRVQFSEGYMTWYCNKLNTEADRRIQMSSVKPDVKK